MLLLPSDFTRPEPANILRINLDGIRKFYMHYKYWVLGSSFACMVYSWDKEKPLRYYLPQKLFFVLVSTSLAYATTYIVYVI